MAKLPVAIQVYSLREDAQKDFMGTMRRVKDMGYDGVELAGLYNTAPEDIHAMLSELGLPAISAHVPYQTLAQDTKETLRQYKTIGCHYIAIPYLEEAHRPGADGFYNVLRDIERIGTICRDMDITLLYHNHDFEFVKMPDGRYALDYIYETIGADILQTEIDTCWVKISGIDPAAYIRKYAGRAPIVHLKDYVGEKTEDMYELIGTGKKAGQTEKFAFRSVGTGVQDIPSLVNASVDAGAKWLVVEQDSHPIKTAVEDAENSIRFLKNL